MVIEVARTPFGTPYRWR